MFLTGLDRVLKAAGVEFTARPGWETRSLHKAGFTSIVGAMYHTSETSDSTFRNGGNAPTLNYVESGLGYPLYNILIGRNGHAELIAAGTTANAGKGSGHGVARDQANRHYIGISADANQYGHPMTPAQLDTMARIGKALDDEWKGNFRHVMHAEWALPKGRRSDPTRIPGGHAALRAAIARGSWKDAAPAKPSPAPKPAKSRTWPQAALPARGKHTTASHNAWVKLLHDVGHLRTTNERLTNGFQRWLFHVGFNPGPVDGNFGPRTTRALQRFLLSRGRLPNSVYVDGDRGPVTIRAEIAYLNSQRRYY